MLHSLRFDWLLCSPWNQVSASCTLHWLPSERYSTLWKCILPGRRLNHHCETQRRSKSEAQCVCAAWIMSENGDVVGLPGSNKSTKDHGEHCEFNGGGESLPVRGRKMLQGSKSFHWQNERTWVLKLNLLQQESFKHHGEKNAEPPQNCKHGQTRRQGNIIMVQKTTTKNNVWYVIIAKFRSSYLSRWVPNSPDIWFPTYSRGRGNICKRHNSSIFNDTRFGLSCSAVQERTTAGSHLSWDTRIHVWKGDDTQHLPNPEDYDRSEHL